MGNNQVVKDCLKTEKPKYLKASNGLVLELIKPIDNSIFEARVVYAGNSTHDVDKISSWYFAEFEPCDYTEPVEVEHPIKGVKPDVNGNPITAKGSADWYKMYPMTKDEEPVEDKPFEFVEGNQNKNPKITELQHLQLMLEGIKEGYDNLIGKLERENTQLKATNVFNRENKKRLEQENAELKADNLKARDCTVELSELLGKSQITITELEAQLAAKSEVSINTEQLPVYDADWLDSIIQNYNREYSLDDGSSVCVQGHEAYQYPLDPKTSADIILRAVAKELNDNKVGTQIIYWMLDDLEYDFVTTNPDNNWGCPLFVNAKKAIDILNQIDPQILKNYFA